VPPLSRTQFRVLCAASAPFIIGAGANYYLDLGWFGRYGKLVLSVMLLLTCVLLALSSRTPRRTS
jgi:hypothetical protein